MTKEGAALSQAQEGHAGEGLSGRLMRRCEPTGRRERAESKTSAVSETRGTLDGW